MTTIKLLGFTPTHPILDEVIADLGGSLFWEENRGNPLQALQRLQSIEADSLTGQPRQDCLLAWGICVLIAGNPDRAYFYFQQVVQDSTEKEERYIVAATFRYIAYIAGFQTALDGQSLNTPEIQRRYPSVKAMQELCFPTNSTIIQQNTSVTTNRCDFLLNKYCSFPIYRNINYMYGSYLRSGIDNAAMKPPNHS